MRSLALLVLLLLAVLGLQHQLAGGVQLAPDEVRALPEFSATADDWLGSDPLTVAALRGRVLMVHVWTFECWNCYRSFPWLNALEVALADRPVKFIGIHTPEFEREKVRSNVAAAMERFKITHPVMMDNDFTYWRALENRYWPAWYLVDKEGNIRSVYIGEVHAGTAQARHITADLERLLAK